MNEFEVRQRVDALAAELLKTGVASSRSDAELRAKSIMSDELRKAGGSASSPSGTSSLTSPEAQAFQTSERFGEELKRVNQKIDFLISEFSRLRTDIKDLRTAVERIPIKPYIQAVASPPQAQVASVVSATSSGAQQTGSQTAPQATAQSIVQTAAQGAEKKDEEVAKQHPRVGSFKQSDIAVDKIFYFGKK